MRLPHALRKKLAVAVLSIGILVSGVTFAFAAEYPLITQYNHEHLISVREVYSYEPVSSCYGGLQSAKEYVKYVYSYSYYDHVIYYYGDSTHHIYNYSDSTTEGPYYVGMTTISC